MMPNPHTRMPAPPRIIARELTPADEEERVDCVGEDVGEDDGLGVGAGVVGVCVGAAVEGTGVGAGIGVCVGTGEGAGVGENVDATTELTLALAMAAVSRRRSAASETSRRREDVASTWIVLSNVPSLTADSSRTNTCPTRSDESAP